MLPDGRHEISPIFSKVENNFQRHLNCLSKLFKVFYGYFEHKSLFANITCFLEKKYKLKFQQTQNSFKKYPRQPVLSIYLLPEKKKLN